MILHWKLDGRDYQWLIPAELRESFRIWREQANVPDQYRDPRPQSICRIFESWIRGREAEARGQAQQMQAIAWAAENPDGIA